MPKVRWGISASDIDDFDREQQYQPYTGPVPPHGVYAWRVKVLKYAAGDGAKLPQLRVGLELAPRKGFSEAKFNRYFVMAFLPISERTNFRYVPFLDALGVTGKDFENRTIADEDGNITRIGKWSNDGSTIVLAQTAPGTDQNGNPKAQPDVNWFGAYDEDEIDEEDSDDFEDDEDANEEDTEDEEEEVEEAPRRKAKGKSKKSRR